MRRVFTRSVVATLQGTKYKIKYKPCPRASRVRITKGLIVGTNVNGETVCTFFFVCYFGTTTRVRNSETSSGRRTQNIRRVYSGLGRRDTRSYPSPGEGRVFYNTETFRKRITHVSELSVRSNRMGRFRLIRENRRARLSIPSYGIHEGRTRTDTR